MNYFVAFVYVTEEGGQVQYGNELVSDILMRDMRDIEKIETMMVARLECQWVKVTNWRLFES